MNLFLKPAAKDKTLISRFSGLTESVKQAQSRLKERQKNKVADETRRIREEISLLKAQNRLASLKENLGKRKKQSQPTNLFGQGGFY